MRKFDVYSKDGKLIYALKGERLPSEYKALLVGEADYNRVMLVGSKYEKEVYEKNDKEVEVKEVEVEEVEVKVKKTKKVKGEGTRGRKKVRK